MANKVIRIDASNEQLSAVNAELYIDVSTDSNPNTTIYNYPKPDINDYMKLLRTEHESLSNVIVAEYSNDESIISAIAIELSSGYEDEYAKYLAYQNASKFKIAKLTNYNAIKNSLHQIFSWIKGERILDPEFGSDLYKLLYEGITDITSERIIAEIRHCVSQYEPRVQILKLENASTTSDTDDNTIQINIIYSVPSLSIEQDVYTISYDYSS